MLRRAAAAAVILAGILTPVAHADGPGGGVCDNSGVLVTVCAEDGHSSSGSRPAPADPASTGGGSKEPADKCSYELVDPPPPAGHLAWKGHAPDDGAVYKVLCESGRGGVVFVPDGQAGPAVPTIDPEVVARQAAASMRLTGPRVASPRAAGTYVVGMPMWMWATPSPTTFGPATASATAGGVTVTATAKVTSIRWSMGDGVTVTCKGSGTPYTASRGKSPSRTAATSTSDPRRESPAASTGAPPPPPGP